MKENVREQRTLTAWSMLSGVFQKIYHSWLGLELVCLCTVALYIQNGQDDMTGMTYISDLTVKWALQVAFFW